MKTTVEINNDLFQRIKALAYQRNSAIKSVIEVALRRFVSEQSNFLQEKNFISVNARLKAKGCNPVERKEIGLMFVSELNQGRGGLSLT